MSSHSANQVAYNAVEQLNATFAQDFANITEDAKNIAQLNSQIQYDKDNESYQSYYVDSYGYGGWVTDVHMSMYNQRIQDQNDLPGAIKEYNKAIATLEAAMGSSQVAELNVALGALNAVIGLNETGTATDSSVDVLSNTSERNALLDSIDDDIQKLLESDECTQAINNLNSLSAANNPNAAAEVAHLAGLRNQDESYVNGSVSTMESLIYNDEQGYTTQLDNAEIKQDHYTTAQIWLDHFDLSIFDEKKDETSVITHSKAMLKTLHFIAKSMTSLGGICGSIQLEQLQELIQVIITKVKAILNDKNISTKGKIDALLPLMMELLGIYKMVRQDTETQKSRNEADMEKAQTQASEAQIQQTKTNETLQAEIAKDNAVGKIASECSKWITLIVGVIMACSASGAASVAILTMTILQFTGVLQKWQNDIASDIVADSSKAHPESEKAAKIWAAVIMTAIEVGVTVGAGVAGDIASKTELLMSIVAKTTGEEATQAAINSAQKAMETAVDEACKEAADASITTVADRQAAKETINNIAEKAGKAAAKRMLSQMFKQNPIMMAQTLLRQATKQVIETTVNDAVMTAIEKSTAVATEAASGTLVSEEAMNQIANSAANQAVADATKKSVETITAEGSRSVLASSGRRAAASAAYGIASTNLLVDIASYGLSQHNESNSKGAQALLITLGIIQGVMEAISMMAGGGFMNQANVGASGSSVMAILQRASAVTQTVNQGAQSAFGFAQTSIDKTKAEIQYKQQISTALSSLIQGFLSNFIQDGTAQRSAFIKEQAEETESQKLLVLNLQKGASEAIKVLTEQAV